MANNTNESDIIAQQNQKEVEANIAKCNDCGSNMVFNPEKQALYCEHCGRVETFDKDTAVQELDILSGMEKATTYKGETVVFRCDNCGAKFVLEKNETANLCPFCGTAHVAQTEELSGIRPNAVIPFLVSKETAIQNAVQWVKKRIFAPRPFKKTFKADKVNGTYMPCFTFDSKTSSTYIGRLGKRYTRVVGSGNNRRTETYIRYFYINGNYNCAFDDVTITAGSKFNQKQYDKMQPFPSNKTVVYEEKYLLGYSAYRYEKDINTCWDEAKSVMDRIIQQKILSGYIYDVIDYIKVSTNHSNVTYKYQLLPVYTSGFTYKQKPYTVFINGTTGKVYGKLPVSILKVLGTIFVSLALVAGIFCLWYFTQ